MPRVVPYSKGNILFFAGDNDDRIFILKSGSITLVKSDVSTGADIRESIKVGEFFGVKSALAGAFRMETAQATADSVVIQLSVNEFEHLFGQNKNITMKMLGVFSKNLRDQNAQMERLLHKESHNLSPKEGLLALADMFENSGDFHSESSVLSKLIENYGDEIDKDQFEKRRIECDAKEEVRKASGFVYPTDIYDSPDTQIVKQFNNPMFDRFCKTFSPGDVIIPEFERGETFYFIKAGTVQVARYIHGEKKNLAILRKGEFFGEMAILDDSPRGASCIARTEATCLEFNKQNFESIITGNPMCMLSLLKLFCRRYYDQHRRLNNQKINDKSIRIQDLFLMYNEKTVLSPHEDPDSQKRQFTLTVSDIADWIGIPLEEAQDEVSKLVKARKIEVFDSYVVVNNISDTKRTVDSYLSALKV